MDRALRYNQHKPKLSLITEMPLALEGITRVLEFGATKYGRRNWQKGMPFTEILDSMLRHQLAWANGEDVDPESGLRHVDHVACNALFLAELCRLKLEFDDRGCED
jgi:hypothetical protein